MIPFTGYFLQAPFPGSRIGQVPNRKLLLAVQQVAEDSLYGRLLLRADSDAYGDSLQRHSIGCYRGAVCGVEESAIA